MSLITLPKNSEARSQPIGIFDSGVGGLSIVNSIKEQLPNEKLIYIADSFYAPYGDKTNEEIIKRVDVVANALIKKNCKAIVIACNTATVTAINLLRKRLTVPIIGVEPGIKPALKNSKNITILTTQATAKNEGFLSLVNKHKNKANVYIKPCPGLVELIEKNQLNTPKFKHLLNLYITDVLKKQVDTIVLGCTHYPFFTDKIKAMVGNHIQIIETALPVTEQLKRQLIKYNLLNIEQETSHQKTYLPTPTNQFYSSKPSQNLSDLMSSLLNCPIDLHPFLE